MKNNVIITVNIRSRPKERPGYNFKQKRAYTKTKTEQFEATLRQMLNIAMKKQGKSKFSKDKPLSIKVFIYLKTPKSWTQKRKDNAINGGEYPIGINIGDIDNHLKSILDACNGSVYEDDRSIVSIISTMKYGEEDKIIIGVEEL